jgi:hypothetical protein
MMRLQWTSFAADFKLVTAELKSANDDFEKEVHFANVQEQSRRHAEVMQAIGSSSLSDFKTNIRIQRNAKFTGRDATLAFLHSTLEPSFDGLPDQRSHCSVLVHAIGGMGKTETTLEYTYRYRRWYSCIFWLRAESRTVLLESFLEAIAYIGVAREHGVAASRKVQQGLEWFQSTGESKQRQSTSCVNLD